MKNLILPFLLCCLFFCNNITAQNSHRIRSVNLHEILNNIHNEIIEKGYDTKSIYLLRDSLGQQMVSQFQTDYQILLKRMRGGCMTQEQLDFYQKKLEKIQDQIISFEKESLRILEENQLKRNQNILLFTKNKIQEFGAKNNTLIMSTDVILFQNDETGDITSTLLKHIHQSKGYNDWIDSFDKNEDLVIQIQKLDYQIKPMFEMK